MDKTKGWANPAANYYESHSPHHHFLGKKFDAEDVLFFIGIIVIIASMAITNWIWIYLLGIGLVVINQSYQLQNARRLMVVQKFTDKDRCIKCSTQ